MNEFEYIARVLNSSELLCQIAEEAGELAQAALKLRRALNGQNPTPTTVPVAYAGLLEEMGDVRNAETAFLTYLGIGWDAIAETEMRKRKRWAERLRERDKGNVDRVPAVAAEEHENMLAAVSSTDFVDAFKGLALVASKRSGRQYVDVLDRAAEMLANGTEPHNVMSYFAELEFGGGAEK